MSTPFDESYYARLYRARLWRRRGDKPVLYRTLIQKLRPYEGGRLLDVGCGEGHFLRRAHPHFEAHGIDLSSDAVQAARRNTGLSTIDTASATSLVFGDLSFDLVCALDVIEHLAEPALFLSEARRVLRERGLLVMSTTNPQSLGNRLKGAEGSAARDDTHIGVRSIVAWRGLLREHGFRIVRDGSDTLWDPPYVRWVPRALQWALFTGLAQLMWSVDVVFPWTLGENYVCFAEKVGAEQR